jgi:hypothetical protein
VRGHKVAFFGAENEVVKAFAERLNLVYLPEGIPAARVYFTDRTYLVTYADYLVQYIDGGTVIYKPRPGCNELVKSAVMRLISLGVVKEEIGSVTKRHIDSGNAEELYRSFVWYRKLIDLEVARLAGEKFEIVGEVEPLSIEELLDYAKQCDLEGVVDSPDFFHLVLYK